MGLFTGAQLSSIFDAIGSEIAAAKKHAMSFSLEIDAIKLVRQVPKGFIYNLLLSRPIHLSADQPLSFHLKGGVTIESVVISSSDEGIVVICSQPLPDNAVVIDVTMDPSFILKGLRGFLDVKATAICPLAERVIQRNLGQPHKCNPPAQPVDLNLEQRQAIAQMEADDIHLLWGPPGTGKTTTLGAAIVRWAQQGKTVLVVSTSNAAVDVALENVVKRAKTVPGLLHRVHRLGKSDHPEVSKFTETPFGTAKVVGCTVAKMVIDEQLINRLFDIVVVDEASMVSLLYAVAAATLASSRLVYGGDFMQLPPISQSGHADANNWFGTNVYDWLGIDLDRLHEKLPMTLLRTQYRMTNRIGDLVSHLCYRDKLVHGRNVTGAPVEVIDIPKPWRETFYSVPEASYYHPFSIPIIHSLVDAVAAGEARDFLLLTPFRPQQSLLGALAFDLREKHEKHRFASSTIHRSQGGERREVILDLTTHSSTELVKFFQDKHSERLLNVGMSRARDHLVIIGNQEMIWTLSQKNPFWERLLHRWDDISVCGADQILDEPTPFDSIQALIGDGKMKGIPSIASYRPNGEPLAKWTALLTAVESPRRLLVIPSKQAVVGSFIVREDTDSPPLFLAQGYVCLPMEGGWSVTRSPNVGRVIWRIGFKHLADEEVQPQIAEKAFQCPKCAPGKLVLKMLGGDLRLACKNDLFKCFYNRPLTLREARMKVRLAGFKCSKGHPMTARQGGTGFFMGCENWPDCDSQPEPLKIIDGM